MPTNAFVCIDNPSVSGFIYYPDDCGTSSSEARVTDDSLAILPRRHTRFVARTLQPALGPLWKTSLPVRACPNRIARIGSSEAY